MYDQLSSLDTSRTTWKIKVRVTRMWPSLATSTDARETLKGYNMILLDDDNSHMHAFVYADNWKNITVDMVEGGLYVITNFYTREAIGTMRPTSSKILINFSNSTTVEKLEEDDFMIPMNKFEFTDLGDLFRIASGYENPDSPEFSTDLMGVLEDFEDAKLIQTKFGERNIVKFRLTDGRYSHKVTVWGQLAVTTNELYDKIAERPIIAIVTSSKLKIYKSSVQISTMPSSKIYLNMDNDFVNAMRLRLEEEGYKATENIMSPSASLTPSPQVIEKITLKELSEKTNTYDEKKSFLCSVKVTSVEEGLNWWYESCLDCQGEATKVEGRYKCSKCNKIIPVAQKSYKIVLLAGDSTEAFNFILSDRASKRIIGYTATKMMSDNTALEPQNSYPQKLKDIAGKDLTLTVVISSDNVLLSSKIFNVIDAYESTVTQTLPSHAIPSTTVSSFAENTIDLSNTGDTPSSSKSVSKRIKMEK